MILFLQLVARKDDLSVQKSIFLYYFLLFVILIVPLGSQEKLAKFIGSRQQKG